MQLTIVMPCLNEALTLPSCINLAFSKALEFGFNIEIIIADNGSTDGSQEIAKSLGAKVIDVAVKGYGSALRNGILAASNEFILMGDADFSYDFGHMDRFVEKLNAGYDLVIGNRFLGGIDKDAMPWKNRYIGNPFLSWYGKKLFNLEINDFHCGLRAVRKSSFEKINCVTNGMEFASEMIVNASLNNLKITEVPTTLRKDGRDRPPHLRPFRDGFRHLYFMTKSRFKGR